MLSPSPRAYVCNIGDRLKVMCNTSETTLQWRLSLMGESDPIDIPVSSTIQHIPRRMINTSRVTVTRASERGETPLISTLEISPVNEYLNGTLNITCVELNFDTLAPMATTAVYITGNLNSQVFKAVI